MEIYTKIPRSRINPNTIGARRSTIFQLKKHCPCVTINMDNELYLDKNCEWVDSIDDAHVMTLEEAYMKTKDMPFTYNIEYILLKTQKK